MNDGQTVIHCIVILTCIGLGIAAGVGAREKDSDTAGCLIAPAIITALVALVFLLVSNCNLIENARKAKPTPEQTP